MLRPDVATHSSVLMGVLLTVVTDQTSCHPATAGGRRDPSLRSLTSSKACALDEGSAQVDAVKSAYQSPLLLGWIFSGTSRSESHFCSRTHRVLSCLNTRLSERLTSEVVSRGSFERDVCLVSDWLSGIEKLKPVGDLSISGFMAHECVCHPKPTPFTILFFVCAKFAAMSGSGVSQT